jgi:hypothetical protein
MRPAAKLLPAGAQRFSHTMPYLISYPYNKKAGSNTGFFNRAELYSAAVLFASETGGSDFIDIALTTGGNCLLRHHADLFASFNGAFADRNTGA